MRSWSNSVREGALHGEYNQAWRPTVGWDVSNWQCADVHPLAEAVPIT